LPVAPETGWRRRDRCYTADYLAEQDRRLAHARRHAQVVISTDELTEEGVLARALAGLATAGVAAADLAVPG
jgi:hypothetical protein